MNELEYSEWVVCGRLPKNKSGKVDLYKIDKALCRETITARRIQLLKRLKESDK